MRSVKSMVYETSLLDPVEVLHPPHHLSGRISCAPCRLSRFIPQRRCVHSPKTLLTISLLRRASASAASPFPSAKSSCPRLKYPPPPEPLDPSPSLLPPSLSFTMRAGPCWHTRLHPPRAPSNSGTPAQFLSTMQEGNAVPLHQRAEVQTLRVSSGQPLAARSNAECERGVWIRVGAGCGSECERGVWC
jgi:hypothetical protein